VVLAREFTFCRPHSLKESFDFTVKRKREKKTGKFVEFAKNALTTGKRPR